MKSSLLLVVGAAIILGGCNKQSSGEAFQDCLINKVSSASDGYAAYMLREVCAKKHQVELPQSALLNLNFKLETRINRLINNSPPHVSITIENGNREWILTEIEYSASPNQSTPQKPYIKTIYTEPLEEGYVDNLNGGIAEESSISLLKAWGVPVKR